MRHSSLSSALLIISLFFIRQAHAQTNNVSFDHIALYVRNLDSSMRFYTQLFHFDTLPHPQLELRYQWYKVGASSAIHIVEGLKDTVNIPFFAHFCFSVPSIDDFAKLLDQYKIKYYSGPDRKKGFRLRNDGVKQLFLQDPDKYWVEVNDVKHP